MSVRGTILAVALLAIGVPSLARAQFGAEPAAFQPRVPVSAFARPAGWFDASRLHISSTVSVGTGWSGGTNALQVTRFSYQFTRPAWLEVSLGNAIGRGTPGGNGMFLEGLRFGFKPSANSVFQIQFQDVRSPLQYGHDPFAPYRW